MSSFLFGTEHNPGTRERAAAATIYGSNGAVRSNDRPISGTGPLLPNPGSAASNGGMTTSVYGPTTDPARAAAHGSTSVVPPGFYSQTPLRCTTMDTALWLSRTTHTEAATPPHRLQQPADLL